MTPRNVRFLSAGVLGLSLLVVGGLVRLGFLSTLPLILAVGLGSAAFLAQRPRTIVDVEAPVPSWNPVSKRRAKVLLATAFFLLSAASIAVLLPVLNEKPIVYYVFVSASAAVLVGFIFLQEDPREMVGALVMVGVFSANILGSNQLAFPGGLGGADSPVHITYLVNPIVAGGTIPVGSRGGCGLIYTTFPGHHLLVASTAIIVGGDPASTYYALGFATMLLPVLVVFLVARKIRGVRTGLLAAAVLAGSSYYIAWASHAAPLTFALPLIAANILVLLKLVEDGRARWLVAAFPLMLALILAHPYSSVIFGVMLFGAVAGHRLVERDTRAQTWTPTVMGVAFAYTLLTEWSNFSCLITKSLQLAEGYYAAFTGEALGSPPAVYDALPLSLIVLNTVGDSILFFSATIGFFSLISEKLSRRGMLVIGPSVTLLVLSTIGLLTRLDYILPNRVYVFLQFAGLAPLAAFGLHHMALRSSSRGRSRWAARGVPIGALLVGAFVLMSSTSIIAGFETSPFATGLPYVKLYETNVEEAAATWLCEHTPPLARVETAQSLHGLAQGEITDCLRSDGTVVDRISVTRGGLLDLRGVAPGAFVVYSEFDLNPGFGLGATSAGQYGQGIYLRLDPRAIEEFAAYDRLYDNGAIHVYRLP